MLIQRFEELLRHLTSQKDVHHAIMAVTSGDGSFQWTGAAGEANPDATAMRIDTPFFIASIDKLYTASIIMKLHENGSIGLDEPIRTYLPDKLIGGLHQLGGVDHTGSISVRHLLSHTSGLADWLEDIPKGDRSLAERLLKEGDMSMSLEAIACHVRDRLTPHFPPQPHGANRQKARYSDTNFILLIAIIEAVTGTPLHEVYEEMLCRPLDLRHTYLYGRSTPLERTADPAALWVSGRPLEIPLMVCSTYGVYSAAEDTLKFLRSLIHGEVFDHPTTPALMQERWNRFGLPFDRAALRLPSWPIEYGLGMMRFHDPVLRLLGYLPRVLRPAYPAPAVIGHTGSTGSWLFYCPQLDLFCAGTVDQATAGALPFRLVSKVLRIVDHHGKEPS
jgi:CubicO group peptidase (beta-lactamase class C family)